MKREYEEGPRISQKFEEAMKILFQTPKADIEQRKLRTPKASSVHKKKRPDRG
jgi:hypothetical protein